MATTYANITPAAGTDGVPYCTNKLLPATEGDLFNLTNQVSFSDPQGVLYGASIMAVVQFQVQGTLATNLGYVVMETDLGDGTWIDVAWCTFSALTGTAVWVLSGGVAGANAFQQTRGAGSAPSPQSGSNQVQLGGRVRFVGKGTVTVPSSSSSATSSSSAAPATVPGTLVTIRHKLLGLR